MGKNITQLHIFWLGRQWPAFHRPLTNMTLRLICSSERCRSWWDCTLAVQQFHYVMDLNRRYPNYQRINNKPFLARHALSQSSLQYNKYRIITQINTDRYSSLANRNVFGKTSAVFTATLSGKHEILQAFHSAAKYRRRPLFNATKIGWRPLLECRAVMLPRRKTRWNVLGCPKLANRCKPLVGQSSRYCEDVGQTLLFNRFFRLSIYALVVKI